jgi:hypothetical protein
MKPDTHQVKFAVSVKFAFNQHKWIQKTMNHHRAAFKFIEHIPSEYPAKARGSISHMGMDKASDERV